MKYEFLQPKFTEGVLAKSLQGRSSEEFYRYGLKAAKNMIPIMSGPVVKRPGTNYIGEFKHSSAVLMPFFKDKDNSYILEIGSTSAESGGYMRVWSQNKLLNDKQSTPAIYEIAAPWFQAQLSTIKFTQSGDVIFVCCPDRPPQIIKRTIKTGQTSSSYAEDDSKWEIYEYETEDGPYGAINVYSEDAGSDSKYALYIADPTTSNGGAKEEIANVEFNTATDSLVLANHGLQTGMKIRLESAGGVGWNKMSDADQSSARSDFDGWVVSTTATTFQIATTDGGTPQVFKLIEGETDKETNIKVYRYVYPSSTSAITFTLYKDGATGTTDTNAYFSSDDIGRQIRINPLVKPLTRIGGIRWAWGIISAVSGSTIGVKLKTEMSNCRGGTPSSSNKKAGTPDFRLGAFSIGTGYPSVSQIYQQRMVLAATKDEPSTIWLSKTADFYTFSPSEIAAQGNPTANVSGQAIEVILDDTALTFTLDSDTLDEIKWLAESKKLTMGTSAGVYMLYGSETNLVVTPFRFTINRESSFSATDSQPVVVSNALMYAQIGGKDVQELLFEGTQGQWFNSKISVKGYDIIKDSEIVKMVWQERPNNIIWMMMNDGRLISLSYDRQTKFQAWSEHNISGTAAKVLDIEMIATASHDQIWLKIERTINSSTKIYMETIARFPTEGALTRNHYVFSDSALTKSIAGKSFTVNSTTNVVTCAGHGLLDGQIIRVSSTGTLPAGLTANLDHYVRDKATDTFKLALTSGGTAISFSNTGSGTHSWVTKEVTGLTHLEGEQVTIYYDGMQHVDKTVSSGKIILDNSEGSDIVVGLSYNGEIETLEPASPPNQFSYTKKLLVLALIVEESLGIQLEYNDLSEELLFRTTVDSMGRQIPLFSGRRKLSLSGIAWDDYGLKITSNGPFPMQINALVIETETGGE